MNINIDDLFFENYVVAGISAGPDSMCLLHLLEEKTNKIIVCHINHNVRKESIEEEAYLRNYCQKHHLIFEVMKIEEYKENNFENEARKKRYKFYEEILNKYHSKYLFLAHHGDDLIETILMKIVRGSNLEGYAGIKEKTKVNNYEIIRPLLPYTKEDIINYNISHNITYFIDSSNKDLSYTRNRFREKILPILKEEDKYVHKKFLRYSKILEEYDVYIKSIVNRNIDKVYKNNVINLNELRKLDKFIQKNMLYSILCNIYNNKNNIIKEKHIVDISKMMNNEAPNLILNLPLNKIAVKEYNKIHIRDSVSTNKKNYQIELKDYLVINDLTFKKEKKEESDGNDVCRINTLTVKMPLSFRNRKNGDYIILKTSNYRKKIKEIFIEKKVPKSIRDNYPLLVDADDNIIWIPNIKKSKFCLKKDENYDIIIKCI
ncbi:MAG: tRNA lysidine(34) synthetase TilS [Bacilli bacterium]